MISMFKKAIYATSCAGACILALAGPVPAQAQPTGAATQTIVRGTVQNIDAQSLQVSTPSGAVTLAIHAPLTVYRARPSDLAHVKNASFVGVTSVRQANGTELAKEIHIFPEELRGTGAGSHMMDAGNGQPSSNRMTNGSVTSTQLMKKQPLAIAHDEWHGAQHQPQTHDSHGGLPWGRADHRRTGRRDGHPYRPDRHAPDTPAREFSSWHRKIPAAHWLRTR